MKKVTIAVITYNHEKFIRQTIGGILIQDYQDYEVVIADDCSTDNTVSIAKEMLDEFQINYTILESKVNKGASKNFKRLIENCKGEYIALLDGDDFWIDPKKLEKQVSFLESNKNYVLSFTRTRILKHTNDTDFKDYIPLLENDKSDFTYVDVLNDLFMPTSSIVFRNNFFRNLPEWFEDLVILDKPLHLLNLQFGEIKYFPDITTVYRVHSQGVWSVNRKKKEIDFLEERLIMLDLLNEELNLIWDEEINKTKKYVENKLVLAKIRHNNSEEINIQKYKVIIDELKEKKIYIFGTGEAGKNLTTLLNIFGVNIIGYYDNNNSKIGKKFLGKIIYNPKNIQKLNNKNDFIIIASMYYDEISSQLEICGLERTVDFIHYYSIFNLKNLKGNEI